MQNELVWLRREVSRVCRYAYLRNLVAGSGGNVSARLPNSEKIIITPSGYSLRDIKSEDLILVDLEGRILEGSARPSKEVGFHIGIYRNRNDVNAIVHLHPPKTVGISVLRNDFPLVTVQSRLYLKDIPLIPPLPAGSKDLHEFVIKEFRNPETKLVILRNHGTVAVGKTLTEALNLTELLEESSEVFLTVSLMMTLRSNSIYEKVQK